MREETEARRADLYGLPSTYTHTHTRGRYRTWRSEHWEIRRSSSRSMRRGAPFPGTTQIREVSTGLCVARYYTIRHVSSGHGVTPYAMSVPRYLRRTLTWTAPSRPRTCIRSVSTAHRAGLDPAYAMPVLISTHMPVLIGARDCESVCRVQTGTELSRSARGGAVLA
eukprot:3941856-Rhodomonas_salina.1